MKTSINARRAALALAALAALLTPTIAMADDQVAPREAGPDAPQDSPAKDSPDKQEAPQDSPAKDDPDKQEAGAAKGGPEAPNALHTPPAALEAGEAMILKVVVDRDWKLDKLWVDLRGRGGAEWTRLPLLRTEGAVFAVRVPQAMLQPPGVEYCIASVDLEGTTRAHFASQQAPHAVQINGDTEETRLAERLSMHGGRRSSFKAFGEATLYGRRLELVEGGARERTDAFSDTFWTSDLEYTYRTLGALYDIRFGLGLMRGQRSTLQNGDVVIGGGGDEAAPEPGLNYGWSEANLALNRNFSLGGRLILGASEEGFAAGVGGVLRIGDIAGTHLAVGGQLLQDAGNVGFMTFAWDTVPRAPMALTIEITERPDADANPLGTRMLLDLGFEVVEGLTLTARIGYAARNEAVEGGPVFGVGATYER